MHELVSQRGGMSRRTMLAAAVTAGVTATAVTAAPGAAALPTGPDAARAAGSARWFADPARSVRPKFRWWWPDGLVDPDEVAREIDQIADAGFGGVEIAAVHHSIRDKSLLDTAHHGWGSRPWRDGVEAALGRAVRRGLTVDLTLGPSWPVAVPGVTPDDDAAAKELAHGQASVAAGPRTAGPYPPPSTRRRPASAPSVSSRSRPPASTPPTPPARRPASTPTASATSRTPSPTAV